MEIRVLTKKMDDNAVVPYKTYDEDFCYDVVATSVEKLNKHTYRYGIGLAFAIERPVFLDRKDVCLGIDLRPRSSVWKTGLVFSNCEGTIDELYRGEVCAVFYKAIPEGEPYKIGDRIGQIKIGVTYPIKFEEVLSLPESKRGENGYGSTGR